MLKLWVFLKFVFCLVFGSAILSGIVDIVLGQNTIGFTVYMVSIFVWMSYVWRYYYPVEVKK
jgi:hypothetical protein